MLDAGAHKPQSGPDAQDGTLRVLLEFYSRFFHDFTLRESRRWWFRAEIACKKFGKKIVARVQKTLFSGDDKSDLVFVELATVVTASAWSQ